MLPRPTKNVQNGASFSGKTRTYWACRKGKSGLSATESSCQVRRGHPCQKEKEQSCLSRVPDHDRGESRWARAAFWRVRGGKSGLHSERRQTPRRKRRARKESLPRTSRRKHERVSGCKSSSGRSAESWFHSKSG